MVSGMMRLTARKRHCERAMHAARMASAGQAQFAQVVWQVPSLSAANIRGNIVTRMRANSSCPVVASNMMTHLIHPALGSGLNRSLAAQPPAARGPT
jgi:hypothetical protein